MLRLIQCTLVFSLAAVAPAFADWQEEAERANACGDAVNTDSKFAELNHKLAIGTPTFEQLADRSIPSENEVPLIRERIERKKPCQQIERAGIAKYHPWMLAAADLTYFQADVVYAQLFQRRITYGNANALLHQSYLDFSAKWSTYLKARSDEERRAQSAAVEGLMRQAHAAPPPPPGASRLNCRWIGPTLYCNAY